jgi:hypothetical protein
MHGKQSIVCFAVQITKSHMKDLVVNFSTSLFYVGTADLFIFHRVQNMIRNLLMPHMLHIISMRKV